MKLGEMIWSELQGVCGNSTCGAQEKGEGMLATASGEVVGYIQRGRS